MKNMMMRAIVFEMCLLLDVRAQQPGYIGGVLSGIGESLNENNKRNLQKRMDAHFAKVESLRKVCQEAKLPFDLSIRCAEPVMALLQIAADKSSEKDFNRAREQVFAVLYENRKRSLAPLAPQSTVPPVAANGQPPDSVPIRPIEVAVNQTKSNPQSRPKNIYEVSKGMTKDAVLAGLVPRYKLSKQDSIAEPPNLEGYWIEDTQDLRNRLSEIFFLEGHVYSVSVGKNFTESPDAVRLIEELHSVLSGMIESADRQNSQNDSDATKHLARILNMKNGTVEIQTQEQHGTDSDQRILFITAGGQTFRLTVFKKSGLSGWVTFTELRQ